MAGYAARLMRFKKIRQFGSAALSLAYVACGRVDAYHEDSIMFWDIAAGVALVRAAGGYARMEDTGGVKWAKWVRCASSETVWNP